MTSERAKEDCLGWAARDSSGFLSPYTFSRRAVRDDDVLLDILFCGICYADVSLTRNHFGNSKYPLVPGHEIVGIVKEVGSHVKRFKAGDHIGVGTYVNSCRECEYCDDGLEVHCSKGPVLTFDSVDVDGTVTKGGYSSYIVVHERYCFTIPDNYPPELAAPLLCAGITVYSPMMRHKMNQPGKSLGVIGLGGLGHLAVKFGKAFGLKVTVFSTSISKREEALNLLGADDFVVSSDEQKMTALAKSLNFIINTASATIPFDPYMALLKTAGILVLVGAPHEVNLSPFNLIMGMRGIFGSAAGGTKETQEMLNFCASHKIYPEVEVVPMQYVNKAHERIINKDIKYRFVIDIANSLKKNLLGLGILLPRLVTDYSKGHAPRTGITTLPKSHLCPAQALLTFVVSFRNFVHPTTNSLVGTNLFWLFLIPPIICFIKNTFPQFQSCIILHSLPRHTLLYN